VETVVDDGSAGAAARLGGVKDLVCSLSGQGHVFWTAVRYRVEGTIAQANANGMAATSRIIYCLP
jgi:hypothetical protein